MPDPRFPEHLPGRATVALLLGIAAAGALAERADRNLPLTLESDAPCTVNLAKQTSQCSGHVVVTQGSLLLRADRLELRETPDGYHIAVADGSGAAPARCRQKRDGVDEHVEGQALHIEYDSKAGTLRFEGDAVVRRLAGSRTMEEIHGRTIVWNSVAELFSVEGGAQTDANPGGRVRAVIAPREAAAASAPAVPLQPSTELGARR